MKDDIVPAFRALFEQAPGAFLVLAPTLRIVAASDAYLHLSMTTREQLIGRPVFDVFPDNPRDVTVHGVRTLTDSFSHVLAHGAPDALDMFRYDIRRPEKEGGAFVERWWKTTHRPLFGPDGKIRYIVQAVEDVTQARHRASAILRTRICRCTIADPGAGAICRRCGGSCKALPYPGQYSLHDLPEERIGRGELAAEDVWIGEEQPLPIWEEPIWEEPSWAPSSGPGDESFSGSRGARHPGGAAAPCHRRARSGLGAR